MKYERLTSKEIERYINIGRRIEESGQNIESAIEDMIRNNELDLWEINHHAAAFIKMGYDGRTPEEKVYYRIGEPKVNHYNGTYFNSRNFADDKLENGISVITEEWLQSLKSVFFGAHTDEVLRARGVYKIRGIEIDKGGDDEPVIYAVDWAEKTRIRTYAGLKKAVKAQ